MTLVDTITIAAPRARVFAYRRDVTTLPEYNAGVRDLEVAGDDVFRFRVRLNPLLSVTTTLTVREVDAPSRVVFEMVSLMNAREVCTFEDVVVDGAPATRVRLETTVKTPGGPIAPLLDRLFVTPNVRRQVAAELRSMKARLEA